MSQTAGGDPPTGGPHDHSDIDWVAAERSPEFQELVKKRRAFVIPALIFVFVWYFGFVALAGYAPDFMGESVYEGLTIGYVFALSQFVMTWVLAAMYLRRADNTFDPLAEKAAQVAVDAGRARAEGARPAPSTEPAQGTDGPEVQR